METYDVILSGKQRVATAQPQIATNSLSLLRFQRGLLHETLDVASRNKMPHKLWLGVGPGCFWEVFNCRPLEQRTMEIQEIRDMIKTTISQITGMDAGAISDSASYEEDLGLDSLSILEITVNVESQFKISASDEELAAIRTVADTVDFVKRRMPAQVT